MKLLGICLGALLFAFMAWATMWFWGQGLTYKPYDHPLMSWTQTDGKSLKALSTDNFDEASAFMQKNPDGILYLNIRVSGNGQLFTATPQELEFISKLSSANTTVYKGNKNFYYSYDFLKSQAPGIKTVDEWLTLKPRFWILNIVDNAIDIDRYITEWVEKVKIENQIVITSEADIVISSLKELHPLWVYGTSLSDLTKVLTMASINLEGLVNFRRDYFITPVILKKREVLNPKVILEMRKRYKKVAIGPVHTDQDLEKALELKPDILILGSSTLDK